MADAPISRGDPLPRDARFYNRIREVISRPPEWARTFSVRKYNPTVVKVSVPVATTIPPWMAMRIGYPGVPSLKQQKGGNNHGDFYSWVDWADEPAFHSPNSIAGFGLVGAANIQPFKGPGIMEVVTSGIVPGWIAHAGTSGLASGIGTHLGNALMVNPEGGGHWEGILGQANYRSGGKITSPANHLYPGRNLTDARLVWLDSSSSTADGTWGLIQLCPCQDPEWPVGWIQTGNITTAWQPVGTYKLRLGRPAEWFAIAQINFVPNQVTATRQYLTISGTQYSYAYVTPRLTIQFRWAVYSEQGALLANIGQLLQYQYEKTWHETPQAATAPTMSVTMPPVMLNSWLSTTEQPANDWAGPGMINKCQLCIEAKTDAGLSGALAIRGMIKFGEGLFKTSRGWNEFIGGGGPQPLP